MKLIKLKKIGRKLYLKIIEQKTQENDLIIMQQKMMDNEANKGEGWQGFKEMWDFRKDKGKLNFRFDYFNF